MPNYVQAATTGEWHWCSNCNKYPAPGEIVNEQESEPPEDERCRNCSAKEQMGTCVRTGS